jgi:hypothetical protein
VTAIGDLAPLAMPVSASPRMQRPRSTDPTLRQPLQATLRGGLKREWKPGERGSAQARLNDRTKTEVTEA